MYFIFSADYHLIFNLNINFSFKHVCLFFKSGRDRDHTHNPNFTLLPSGHRYRSFVPSTIADLNKIPHWILCIDVCVYIHERVYSCIQVYVARQKWAWMIIYDHISTIFVLHICMFFCEIWRCADCENICLLLRTVHFQSFQPRLMLLGRVMQFKAQKQVSGPLHLDSHSQINFCYSQTSEQLLLVSQDSA